MEVIGREAEKCCQLKHDLLQTRVEVEGQENQASLLNIHKLLKKPLTTARFALAKFDSSLLKFEEIIE